MLFVWLASSVSVVAQGNTQPAGFILREAKCKVLIVGPLPVDIGDVVDVARKPNGQGGVIGRVRIVKVADTRISGIIVDSRGNCPRFQSAYVLTTPPPAAGLGSDTANRSSARTPRVTSRKRSSTPSRLNVLLGVGPGISNSTLKGISRDLPQQDEAEQYPVVLATFSAAGDIYPLALAMPKSDGAKMVGIEGVFRYIASSSDVKVAVPAPGSGQEVNLDLAMKRLLGRGGALLRIPLWKNRLFADARAGYYFSRFTSTISKFTSTPEGTPKPFELSPLRDMGLGGFYVLAGAQFQPVNSFRARVNFGSVLGPNYQIDNRPSSSTVSAPAVNAKVEQPTVFLLEALLAYLVGPLQLGLDVSLENFSGQSLFPDGVSRGPVGESYFNVGLNIAFLL